MSLVNKMLRDLENSNSITTNLDLQTVNIKKTNHSIWIVLFSIIIGIAIFLFWNQQQKNTIQLTSNNVIASKTPPQQTKTNNQTVTTDKNIITKTESILDKPVKKLASKIASIDKKPLALLNTPKKTETITKNKPVKTAQTNPIEKKKDSIWSKEKSQKQVANNNVVIKTSRQTQLKRQLQKIQLGLASNGYDKTKNETEKLLMQAPDFHSARFYLIQIAQKYNDPNLDQKLIRYIKDFPKVSNYQLITAKHFYRKKALNQVINVLNNITPEQADYYEMLKLRGLSQQQLSNHTKAIIDYQKILKFAPNRGDIYLAIGISFEAINDLGNAKRSFQNALSDRRLSTRQRQFIENKINQYQG